MLQRLDAGATPVTPVARAEPSAAVGDTRQEAFQRSLRTMLGQPMRGEVLSRLTDGSYLVRVHGTAARMMLPADAKLGAEIPMTLLAVEPRPTFRVGEPGAGRISVA
ncbi:MAG: flagellar hook-length control protein FliK, partial [Burkholderiaceae bacterium]|nr:flagellar hook-length control protein FliK [Burkholderiaceae bacterium]